MSVKNKYAYIGRKVCKIYPDIANTILKAISVDNILSDPKDFKLLAEIFSEFYNINFPGNFMTSGKYNSLHGCTTITDAVFIRVKFIAFLLYCYDKSTIVGPVFTRVKWSLRAEIADFLGVHKTCGVSPDIKKIRVYMRAYKDFENDVKHLVGIVNFRLSTNDK